MVSVTRAINRDLGDSLDESGSADCIANRTDRVALDDDYDSVFCRGFHIPSLQVGRLRRDHTDRELTQCRPLPCSMAVTVDPHNDCAHSQSAIRLVQLCQEVEFLFIQLLHEGERDSMASPEACVAVDCLGEFGIQCGKNWNRLADGGAYRNWFGGNFVSHGGHCNGRRQAETEKETADMECAHLNPPLSAGVNCNAH